MSEWYSPNRHDDQVTFARILWDAGHLTAPEDFLHYMEEPWSYDPEHQLWVTHGEPTADEPERFDDFCIALALDNGDAGALGAHHTIGEPTPGLLERIAGKLMGERGALDLDGQQPDEEPYPTCSICDGIGHGYPGAGPCPIEEPFGIMYDDDPHPPGAWF